MSAKPFPKGSVKVAFVVSVLLFSGGLELRAQSAPASEYQIKAVFLFNFAQFVEWPSNAFPAGQAPLVVGVLGQDPFGAYLDEIVRGERVYNRSLTVKRYRRVEEIQNCQVLFIGRSEAGRLGQILDSLKYKQILTVADFEGAARSGVIIRFVIERNKIRLRINLEAAKAASLMISSKLLRQAEIVTSDKD